MSELIYCLAAKQLPTPNKNAKVLPLTKELYKFIATEGTFLPRDNVEEDENYRQIIPYAVIVQEDKVFLVERLKKGNETRLHNFLSIGIGGHINDENHSNAQDIIEGGLAKELQEELHIGVYVAEAIGLLHDNASPVSRVHTGVLYKVKSAGEVSVKETNKLMGKFTSWQQVTKQYDALEGWSRAALDYFHYGKEQKPLASLKLKQQSPLCTRCLF